MNIMMSTVTSLSSSSHFRLKGMRRSSGAAKRESATLEESFWKPVFENTDFAEFIKKQYTIGYHTEIDLDEILEGEI